jgi:hypothetical protein
MSTKNREQKIISAVSCPTCHARVGQPCRMLRGRPMVCTARKEAWQVWRDSRPSDYVITVEPASSALIAPQSAEAIERLHSLARGRAWEWIGGAVRVPGPDVKALVRALIAEGWITSERQ